MHCVRYRRSDPRITIWFLNAAIAGMMVSSNAAVAHDFSITQAVALFKADGTYWIDVRVDLDALALGVSSSLPSAEIVAALRAMEPLPMQQAVERARQTVLKRVWIRFDDQKTIPEVDFPEHGRPLQAPAAEPSILGTTARFFGRVPEGATAFSFGASRAFGAVQFTILDEITGAGVKHVLGVGVESLPYRLYEVPVDETPMVLARYLVLGFEHIVPKGVDHILFVLGLFLLSARFRPLLWQVTAFTVAHSVTLALSMADVASLPSGVVEPLIALSITYVAVENIFVRDLKPWRPVVVFGFGLLHGMGFAGVLQELGMPGGQFVPALVGFNIGVEFGQLTVIAMAFLALGWYRKRSWYRNTIIRPISLAIALVGAYWAIERAFLST